VGTSITLPFIEMFSYSATAHMKPELKLMILPLFKSEIFDTVMTVVVELMLPID